MLPVERPADALVEKQRRIGKVLDEIDRDVLQRKIDAVVAAFKPLRGAAQAGPDFGRQADIFDGDFSIREGDGRRLRQSHRVLVTEINFE